ncbi:DUF3302 domain-containing protein [Blastopirellula sp. JC732]|uniref:DUF3302 domain-containing protein n=1 Tax=Blastopirellula sediminis TaxID=2894196 RepID=A0A9X1MQ02_9BACT|nr:DUF3302 domain-containing protein [Blastopirellula sediminis]MCC9605377.1 DUF3302 domain-containing protein [Blastopirellula sediminis]MCC9631323.1 DUF3302 domain-containing protein [Blastopirellula sediminis]
MDALSWFALGIIFFVLLALVYGFIALHDVPYNIAKARNHPHQDAIHAGGWISLFTLHAIWPFLWIWAYSYDPETGYLGRKAEEEDVAAKRELADALKSEAESQRKHAETLEALERRIVELEQRLTDQATSQSAKSEREEG